MSTSNASLRRALIALVGLFAFSSARVASATLLMNDGIPLDAGGYHVGAVQSAAVTDPSVIGFASTRWASPNTTQVLAYNAAHGLEFPAAFDGSFTAVGGSVGLNYAVMVADIRGNYKQLASGLMSTNTSPAFYFRMLVNIESNAAARLEAAASGNAHFYGAGLNTQAALNNYKPAGTGFTIMFFKTDAAPTYRLSLVTWSNGNFTEQAALVTNAIPGKTYLVLVEIARSESADTLRAFAVDNDSYDPAAITLVDAGSTVLSTSSTGALVISGDYGPGGYTMFDEFALGTEITDVVVYISDEPKLDGASVAKNPESDSFDVTASMRNNSAGITVVATPSQGDAITWAFDEPLGEGETNSIPLTGLAASTTYDISVVATNSAGTDSIAAGTIYTGTPALAFASNAIELGLVPGTVTVSRASADAFPLTVNYAFTGTGSNPAVEGVNYEAPSGSVTIAAGEASAAIVVIPRVGDPLGVDTTLSVSLAAGNYFTTGSTAAPVAIIDAGTPAGYKTWIAAEAGSASVGANWSPSGAPLPADNILFDGNYSNADCEWDLANGNGAAMVASWTQTASYTGTINFNTTFPDADATLTNIVISGGCTLANGTWTHPAATADTHAIARNYYRLRVSVGGSMTLGADAKIDLNGKGCWAVGAYYNGSYGGQGDRGTAFGDPFEPADLGSSNGADDGAAPSTPPAYAGGALWLEVADALAFDGSITSDGISRKGWNYSGGSGGSVYIKAASMSGAGTISANGKGTGGSTCNNAGSGGRISILLTVAETLGVPEAKLTAYGSSVYRHVAGAGTIVIRTPAITNGRLIVREASNKYGEYAFSPTPGYMTPVLPDETWTFDSVALGSHGVLYVPAGATLRLPGGLASIEAPQALGGNRTCGLLIDGGTLDIPAAETHVIDGKWTFSPNGPYELEGNVEVRNGGAIGVVRVRNISTNEYTRLDLTVHGDVLIDKDSFLLADDAGLSDTFRFEGTGQGAHGGAYGSETYTTEDTGYDSILNPILPGNSGVDDPRRVGGGALMLKVDGTLTLNGTAKSGPTIMSHWAGGMGTINLTAGKLEGTGRISVTSSQGGNWDSGGGYNMYPGGGRVAVRLTDEGETFSDWWKTNIFARGTAYNAGDGTRLHHSSAGTVYLQDAIEGEGAGTVYIAQNGLAINWTTACTNDLTAFPSTRHGGENDYFRRVSLDVSGGAHVLASRNVSIKALTVAEHSTIELNGKRMKVMSCALNGVNIGPGVYSASDPLIAEFFDDASEGQTGTLEVWTSGTMISIR